MRPAWRPACKVWPRAGNCGQRPDLHAHRGVFYLYVIGDGAGQRGQRASAALPGAWGGAARTRLEVATRRGLVRFVGRQGELAQLHKALEQARGGRGRSSGWWASRGWGSHGCTMSSSCARRTAAWCWRLFPCRTARPHPYLPLIDLLKRYFELAPQDDGATAARAGDGEAAHPGSRAWKTPCPTCWPCWGIDEATGELAQMDPPLRRRRTSKRSQRAATRKPEPAAAAGVRRPPLDRRRDRGAARFLADASPDGADPATGELSPRISTTHGATRRYYTQLRLDRWARRSADELLTALTGL